MKHQNPKHCPFVENPSDECYVQDMGSQNTAKAIYYCGSHYEECEKYKARMAAFRETSSGENSTWKLIEPDAA